MATINEIIQSAVDRVKLKGSETWIKWSFWTRAKDVELNSGKNVETAVSELDENISNEIDRATDRENEIETALNSEITRAKSAESTLSTSINNEITRAKNAESTLETNKVPITRTINGKALSSNITLSSSDVGADASGSANTALTNAKAYTDTKVADLVGSAPETLDTLEELADALKDNADIVDVLNEAITSKASAVDLTSHTSNNTAHITADERTAWNDANNKKHEHTNKTILDNTTASYTTEEKEKLSGIKDGAESTATTTSGSNPTVTNSADAQLIYGKIAGYTMQDGVPTSDSPIDIQGLGDSGSVEVKTCGKNLLNYSEWAKVGMPYGTSVFENNGVTITATRDDTYTNYQSDKFPEEARVYVEEGKSYTLSWEESTNQSGLVFIFPNGLINNMRSVNNSTKKSLTYTANNDVSFITFRFGVEISGTTISYKNIQIEENVVATDFEPYTETTAIIPLDLPLYDGDYIEVYADGSGKIVRTMGKKVITSSDYVDMPYPNIFRYVIHEGYDSSGSYTDRELKGYSNRFAIKQSYDDMTIYDAMLQTVNNDGWGGNIRATITMPTSFNTKELMNEFVDNNEVYFIYPLKESVETELTAEQVTQFKKLYTFDNVTNFFCDGEITVRYYVNTDSGDTVGMMQKSISELQEIEIGGRNYCRNNSCWKTRDAAVMQITNNDDGSVSITKIADKNTIHCYIPFSSTLDFGEYTLTVKYKATEQSGITFYDIARGNGAVDELVLPQSDDYIILSKTVMVAQNTDALFITSTAMVLNSTLDIAWIKVEKGNKSTDWTPNPDDDINATTATKLETVRTINDTDFDGSANIRTKTSYNLKFGQQYANNGQYRIFAKLPKVNTTGNQGCTLLVTDVADCGRTHNGAWIVQCTNRGTTPTATMQVRSLLANHSDVKFGYYSDDDYFYFGLMNPAYSAGTFITVLSKRENNNSEDKTTIGCLSITPTKPSDWTVVETKYTPQPSASDTVAGIMKLYTVTGGNTDGSMTQSAITSALGGKASKYEWTAKIKGQTWSRIFQVKTSVSVIGNSGILNVSFTRGNVVCNATFMITTSHKNKCFITQLSANSYSPFKIRGVANTHGDAYIELYDYTASISTATEQAVYCRFIPLRVNTVNVYTEFVDGTTVPTDYTANDPLTVDITGGSMVASKFVGNADTATCLTNSYTYDTRPTSADDFDTFNKMGIMFSSSSMTTNKPNSDGAIMQIGWDNPSSPWNNTRQQLFIPHEAVGNMQYRGWQGSDTTGTWWDWRTLLDTNNYTSYTVKKDGTGASGTWGIGVTGNAATATKLKTARTISLTGSVTGSGTFDGSGNLSIATTTNHTHNYLPLSGGTLTGNLTMGDTKNIMLRTNETYSSGICYDTKGNECISLWAKNAVTRLRWNAGVDMSTMVSGKMMDITPDFEISKASGSAMGYIAGARIVTNSGTWGISVTGNAATATKLKTARTISLTGSVTGSGTFDGSGNLSIATTTNHTHNYLPLAGGTMTGDILCSSSRNYYIGSYSTPFGGVYVKDFVQMNGTNPFISSGIAGDVLHAYSSSSIAYGTSPQYVTDKAIYFGNILASSVYKGDYIELNSYSGWISANTSISIYSDEKVKNFTEDIETDEDKLIKIFDEIILRSYTYKSSKNNSLSIGLSGQELEQLCLDNDIDPEKYNFLNIRYNYRLDNGDGEENTKFYLKFITISYEELYALALLKIKRMEKEHISRLNQSETEIAELKTEMSEVNDKLNEIMTLLNSN